MCKVSIVIPIYNTAKYLDRCLESVVNQTLKDIEIILVDDGSKDEAPAMCDDWKAKDERIRVIHKENAGLGFARNSGLEVANGEFVAFLDSDDFVELDMYERLYNTAKEKNVDTCLCGHKKYYDDGHYEEKPNRKAGSLYLGHKVYKDVLLEVLGTLPEYAEDLTIGVSTCMGIYSVAVFKDNDIRFCSERQFISEDLIMNVDYYKFAKGVYIIDYMPYYYCANGESLSKSFKTDRIERNMIMYKEILRRLEDYEYREEGKLRLDRTMLGFARVHAQHICSHFERAEAIKELKKICDNKDMRRIISVYPYKLNPMKYRIFNFCIDKKLSGLMWLMVKSK